MEGFKLELIEGLFRWAHVVAGVTWIGLLYFFNWINGPFGATQDAETKQKALPELLPRTLYFFRWGAAFTWLSGLGLLGLVYYMNDMAYMSDAAVPGDRATPTGISFLVAIIVGPMVYDLLWKSPLAKNNNAAVGVSFVLVVALAYVLQNVVGVAARGMYIHIGALFGTAMAFNVWMRIWPAQRKIIAAIRDGNPPDADLKALAGLRSKHNTYMSFPLIFLMVSSHYPTIYGYGDNGGWIMLAGVVAIGWWVCSLIYKKSKTETVAAY